MSVTIRTATPDSAQLPRLLGGRAASPDEWDQWSEEPGHDLVAQDGSRVVGGLHVSLVSRSEAWLENLRVHPDAQGRGIAAQLVREGEAVARRYGAAVTRTAIPAHEYAAQAVAARAGYRPALQCVVLEAPLPPGPAHMPYDAPLAALGPGRANDLMRFLESTPALTAWRGLVPLGWRFRRIVPELVRGLLKDHRAITALHPGAEANAVQAAALFALRGDAAVLSVLDGSPSGVQAVFGAVTEEARAHEATRAAVFAPELRSLDVLGVRGWTPHPWCPEGLVVVEKSLAS